MIQRKLIKVVTLKRRIAERIKRSYFVRFHMFMILSATVLSGVVCSKILIMLGVTRMPVRYGITIVLSYLLFFMFVKLWLLYIGVGRQAALGADESGSSLWWTDVMPSPGGSTPSSGTGGSIAGFEGGASGGGGAEINFGEGVSPIEAVTETASEPGVADGLGKAAGDVVGGTLDVGDESGIGLIVIILLAALVLSVVVAGGYLIWCAPTILSDAVFQVLLVTSFAGKVKQAEKTEWETTIFKATWWVFLMVLVFSIVFGVAAQKMIPAAVTIRDLFTML
ncbi:MAG: hypothetical protein ABFD82_22110 [Syntrophaceae bacterium]